MGAWRKIRFEVKEEEAEEGGKSKTKIRLTRTYVKLEKEQRGYTPRINKEGRTKE